MKIKPVQLLVLALLTWGSYNTWMLKRERNYSREAEHRGDSLAADAFVARQQVRGWTVHFGAENPEQLDSTLSAWDSTYRADAKASRVRITSLVQLVATLQGHVESRGTVDSTAAPAASHTAGSPLSPSDSFPLVRLPTQALGRVDDGLLTGTWSFRYADAMLALNYRAQPGIQLTQALAGDGRTVVSARGTDPRVTLQVQDVIVDPVRVEVRSCTLGQRLTWAGGGILTGLLLPR